MNQVSTLTSLAGLLFIAGIKKPLKAQLTWKDETIYFTLKISPATLYFESHLFSLPLVKIVICRIKESMRRLVGQTDI